MVKRHKERARDDKTYIWGIFDKKSGELVGTLDIHILHRDPLEMANLGYRIFNTHWRKGIANECLKVLIPKALVDLRLNRLEAVIDPDNMPSIKLVESLKMRSEGIRKNYYYQDGRWDDQIVFIADRKDLKLTSLKP